MKTLSIMLAIVLMSSGCSTFRKPNQPPLPSELMQPCKDVIVLQSGDRASVMKNITTNAFNQQECIDKHKALVEAVKQNR